MDSQQARLTRCFSAVFPELGEQEIFQASLTSVEGWDSVATVTLLALVEEEFGISFDPQDVDHLVSFEGILDHVRKNAGVP